MNQYKRINILFTFNLNIPNKNTYIDKRVVYMYIIDYGLKPKLLPFKLFSLKITICFYCTFYMHGAYLVYVDTSVHHGTLFSCKFCKHFVCN